MHQISDFATKNSLYLLEIHDLKICSYGEWRWLNPFLVNIFHKEVEIDYIQNLCSLWFLYSCSRSGFLGINPCFFVFFNYSVKTNGVNTVPYLRWMSFGRGAQNSQIWLSCGSTLCCCTTTLDNTNNIKNLIISVLQEYKNDNPS